MKRSELAGWFSFWTALGAYVPLLIGGLSQPADMNVACFSIWIILAWMATYSAKKQDREGWKLQLAFFVGNIVTVGLMLWRGGYTNNLTLREYLALGAIIGSIATWVAVGSATKRWNPDYLYWGSILADVISFYPVFKQFSGVHEMPSRWFIAAWVMFGLASAINFTFTERLFEKLWMDPLTYGMTFGKKKTYGQIVTTSAFSLENFILITITTILMVT